MWLRYFSYIPFACMALPSPAAAETPLPGTFFVGVEGVFDGVFVTPGLDVPIRPLPGGGTAVLRFTNGSVLSR